MAYFNTAEDRYRQSNLHLVRPARLGNRRAIEDMYEHRYQKQLGQMVGLMWRILTNEGGGPRMVFYYGLMHLAMSFDRLGLRGVADVVRRAVSLAPHRARLLEPARDQLPAGRDRGRRQRGRHRQRGGPRRGARTLR